MNEQLVQEILSRLDSAGEIAVEGFGILIRQVYIEALRMSLWVVALLVLAYMCYRVVRNFGHLGGEHVWATDRYDDPDTGAIMFSILGVIVLLVAFGLATGVVARLVNPEFYALKWVLQTVGA